MKHSLHRATCALVFALSSVAALAQSGTASNQYLGQTVAPVLAVELSAAPERAQTAPASTSPTSSVVTPGAGNAVGTSERRQALDNPSTYTGLSQSEAFRNGSDIGARAR
jgi:hypothetical protein